MREAGNADGFCCSVARDDIACLYCGRGCADMAVKPPVELMDMSVGICTGNVRGQTEGIRSCSDK